MATSAAGTELEIMLEQQYSMVSAIGRPSPGEADNLPSGSVYTHPGTVEGTFVADRAVLSSSGSKRISRVTRARSRWVW